MADLVTIINQTTTTPREWQGTNVVTRAQFILPNNLYQVGGLAPMFGASDPCLDDFELCMPVFASSVQTGDFYNDYTRLLAFNLSAVTWTLQKLTAGVWNNVESPIAAPTGVVAVPQLFYNSLVLSWREVLLAYGTGTYRITTGGFATLSYVLQEFSCEAAVGTFKLKTTNKGKYTSESRDFIIPFAWEDEIRYYGGLRLAADSPFRNDLRFSEFETNDRIVKNTIRKQYRALFYKGLNPLFERYMMYGFSGIDSTYTDYYSANQEHIVSRVLVGDTSQGYTPDIATNISYKFEARLLSGKDLGYRNELEN